MSIKVKLKRGNMEDRLKYGLDKYEIGIDTDEEKVYIGIGDGKSIPLTDCEKVNHLLFENGVEWSREGRDIVSILPDTGKVYKFDLRDIRYIDDFDEHGVERLLTKEFDGIIDGDVELYKWQSMDDTSPYLLRKYTMEEANALIN